MIIDVKNKSLINIALKKKCVCVCVSSVCQQNALYIQFNV